MLRSLSTSVSRLALLGLLTLASIGCAQGGEGPLLLDSTAGPSGSTSGVTQGSTSTGSGAGGAGGAGASTTTAATTTSSGNGHSTGSFSSSSGTFSSSSSGTFSSTTGGGTCDSSANCGTCGNCALVGACQSAMNACQSNQNCTALLGCLQGCMDQTCANNCATQYPGGQQLYMAMIKCVVCQECPTSCMGSSPGTCGP